MRHEGNLRASSELHKGVLAAVAAFLTFGVTSKATLSFTVCNSFSQLSSNLFPTPT